MIDLPVSCVIALCIKAAIRVSTYLGRGTLCRLRMGSHNSSGFGNWGSNVLDGEAELEDSESLKKTFAFCPGSGHDKRKGYDIKPDSNAKPVI